MPRRMATACTACALVSCFAATDAAADWDQFNIATGRSIEGYASEVSVAPGRVLHFHVSTKPSRPYRIEIYRLGPWKGAAPRLLTCLRGCHADGRRGRARRVPRPDTNGRIDAGWPVTDRFRVPRSWKSGYYVAKLLLVAGPSAYKGKLVPFIVRESRRHRAKILVQAAVNTWQAYNCWGGKSLYPCDAAAAANRVSFNRPYAAFQVGGQSLFDWELQLARFLERNRYDVSYTTDVDVDRTPSSLRGRRLVISSGHDEYWTKRQRDAFEAARDARPRFVNLVFSGGNVGIWQVRYENRRRTIVGHKDFSPDPNPNPALRTTTFRDAGRPPCLLGGVESRGGLLTGPGLDYSVVPASAGHPWFKGTGLNANSKLRRLVGYEWDEIRPGCRPATAPGTALAPLFHFAGDDSNPQPADAVAYTAPSGARVFSAGTLQFSWGLDRYGGAAGHVDRRVQAFFRNVLNDLGGRPSRR